MNLQFETSKQCSSLTFCQNYKSYREYSEYNIEICNYMYIKIAFMFHITITRVIYTFLFIIYNKYNTHRNNNYYNTRVLRYADNIEISY